MPYIFQGPFWIWDYLWSCWALLLEANDLALPKHVDCAASITHGSQEVFHQALKLITLVSDDITWLGLGLLISDVDFDPGHMVRKLQPTRQGARVFLFLVLERDDGELQLSHQVSSMRLVPHSQRSREAAVGHLTSLPTSYHIARKSSSVCYREWAEEHGDLELPIFILALLVGPKEEDLLI